MIAKDCSYELRSAFYQALSGMTYNSQAVGVYDEIVPENALYPAVILCSQLSRADGNKDSFTYDTTFEINVIKRYTSDEGGKKEVNDITNIIVGRIVTGRSTNGLDAHLTNFKVVNCEYQTNSLILQLPTGWQVEQNIIFSQLLNQLN